MTVVLEGLHLSKNYGGVVALSDVSLRVDLGECVGIIGPNGSGKSTLFSVLTGYLKQDAGHVVLNGTDVTRLPSYRRSRLGLVRSFQERMVFADITVLENLRVSLIASGRSDDMTAGLDAVDLVGLPHSLLHELAGNLSWGQARLLGIALGVVVRPKVLLLDEPFAGLNRIAAKDVTSALTALRHSELSLVLVEHEMSLLLPMCDRVVVLADGQIVAEDHPDHVLTRPEVQLAYFGRMSVDSSPDDEQDGENARA